LKIRPTTGATSADFPSEDRHATLLRFPHGSSHFQLTPMAFGLLIQSQSWPAASSARRRSSPTRGEGERERNCWRGKFVSRHQSQALFVIVTSYRPPRYAKGGCSFRLSVECGRTKRHLLTGMKSTAAGRHFALAFRAPKAGNGREEPASYYFPFFFSLSLFSSTPGSLAR